MKSKHTKGKAEQGCTEDFFMAVIVENTVVAIIPAIDGEFGKYAQSHNMRIVRDAFNVTNETNKTPRELQKSHDELFKSLQSMVSVFEGETMHPQGSIEAIRCSQANRAIKNAKP
jgi:hypothetical protein